MQTTAASLLLILALILISPFVQADQLLVILEAKTEKAIIDWAAERGAKLYIQNKLRSKYDKIYFFQDTNPTLTMRGILNRAIKERSAQERLDVLAFQHGPKTTPFNGLFNHEVEKLLPYGYIRHLYSSGCDNWGKIKFGSLDKIESISKYNLSKHLANLGVDSYIIYVNVNSTTQHNLFTIVDNLANPDFDWVNAMYWSLLDTDLMTISKVDKLAKNLPLSEWLFIDPLARPVFGFNQSRYPIPPVSPAPLLANEFTSNKNVPYFEVVMDMSPALKESFKNLCASLANRFAQSTRKPFRGICQY